jgi:hypothetical protein
VGECGKKAAADQTLEIVMKSLSRLLLLALPLFAAAEVVVPIDSVEDHVNIRMSADPQSEIVGHLNQGDYLQLVASAAGWHEVAIAGGATGFISADWTTVLAEPPAPVNKDDSSANRKASEEPLAEGEEIAADIPEVTEADVDKQLIDQEPVRQFAGEVADDVEEVMDAGPDEDPDKDAVPQVVEDSTGDSAGSAPDETVSVVNTQDSESPEADVDVDVTDESTENGAAEIGLAAEKVSAESEVAVPEPTALEPVALSGSDAASGQQGPQGPPGIPGPPGPAGAASIQGSVGFLTKFTAPTVGGSSLVFDDGNNIGIGTTEPKQRLEVNGNIQIHERNSSVAGLMITQSDGETGYIMHNRASTLTIGAGSVDRITIDRNGNVGFGVSRPANPIEMASGAHVTAGGVWTNSSSRARKENIAELSLEDALATLTKLEPVRFNYKNDRSEQYVGFIAEDVPDLVATNDRDGLSSMDIVAVLTRVVQEQQRKIEALEARLNQR